MANKDPRDIADKYIRNLTNATEDMRKGVENTLVNPAELAIKAIPKMKQNLVKAIDSGKVERGLRRVSLEDWKQSMLNKGIDRVAQGAEGAREKLVDFHTDLQAHQNKLDAKLAAMPKVTLQNGIDRMIAQVKGMAEFQRSR